MQCNDEIHFMFLHWYMRTYILFSDCIYVITNHQDSIQTNMVEKNIRKRYADTQLWMEKVLRGKKDVVSAPKMCNWWTEIFQVSRFKVFRKNIKLFRNPEQSRFVNNKKKSFPEVIWLNGGMARSLQCSCHFFFRLQNLLLCHLT